MNNANDPLQLLRKEYAERMLRRDELNTNPLMQFDAWMNEAVRVQMQEPNAACLSTCGSDGLPRGRMVQGRR